MFMRLPEPRYYFVPIYDYYTVFALMARVFAASHDSADLIYPLSNNENLTLHDLRETRCRRTFGSDYTILNAAFQAEDHKSQIGVELRSQIQPGGLGNDFQEE